MGLLVDLLATNLLTASAASLVQPYLAMSNSYSPVLGQVVGSQQDFVEQEWQQ